MSELRKEAISIIKKMIHDGLTYNSIMDFLEDGEALKKAGITNKKLVEEMYTYCRRS